MRYASIKKLLKGLHGLTVVDILVGEDEESTLYFLDGDITEAFTKFVLVPD